MRKTLCLIGTAASILLTGCSYTKYTYSNEPMNYTIVASGDTQQASDNKASRIVSLLCLRKGMQGQINAVYRISNLRLDDVQKTPAQYHFTADKTKDYLTVIDITCVQPVVSKIATKKS